MDCAPPRVCRRAKTPRTPQGAAGNSRTLVRAGRSRSARFPRRRDSLNGHLAAARVSACSALPMRLSHPGRSLVLASLFQVRGFPVPGPARSDLRAGSPVPRSRSPVALLPASVSLISAVTHRGLPRAPSALPTTVSVLSPPVSENKRRETGKHSPERPPRRASERMRTSTTFRTRSGSRTHSKTFSCHRRQRHCAHAPPQRETHALMCSATIVPAPQRSPKGRLRTSARHVLLGIELDRAPRWERACTLEYGRCRRAASSPR